MNIAIDGPAGAGKSTIARKVADALGSIYIDTGAMYRAMAFHMLSRGIDSEDREAVLAELPSIAVRIAHEQGEQHVYLNEEDVTGELRREDTGRVASRISRIPEVRAALTKLQQEIAAGTPVVMDGRDIGTVVLPDAECKIFLTASPAVRAARRYTELLVKQGKDPEADWSDEEFRAIERDMAERDEKDRTREIAPLKKAEDAILLDSSDMSVDEVAARILALASGEGV